MKLSLRQRLLTSCLLILALSLSLVSFVSYLNARKAVIANLTHEMEQICLTTVKHIEDWVADQQINLEYWAGQKVYLTAMDDSFVGLAARKAANLDLQALIKRYDHYERIHLLGTNGLVLASSDTNQIQKLNLGDRQYFKDALNGKVALSEAVISKVSNKPIIALAAPVRDGDKVVGVLAAIISLGEYSKDYVDPVKVQENGYIFLFDKRGLLLAHPNKGHILNLNLTQYDWGRELVQKESGTISYQFEGQDKLVAFRASAQLGWGAAATVTMKELLAPARRIGLLTLLIGVSSLALSTLIVLWVVRSIAKPLDRAITGLNESSNQVASAAAQVTSSSQSLAEGASEQAASLEETSASLEEMASMTQRNAENAQKANELANQTRHAADVGVTEMQAMTGAMQDLKKSSDDIGKIIKTIDEIAFQTNILALNAAVEAARAGSAGAGFAVVADEVRNLAQRSAQAARETSDKIEATIAKTAQGVQISERVARSLQEIVEKARKVDHLAAEVATASKEQNQGIKQVNVAVSQMDKVTQANAASAEESASAAEELNAQAGAVKETVAELKTLVEGAAQKQLRGGFADTAVRRPASATPHTMVTQPAKIPKSMSAKQSAQDISTDRSTVAAPAPELVKRSSLPMPAEGAFKDF